jgi:crotonobetainyl-CoA:carnitine CoA-transferase CaiB-like acyl-CoA transferase
MPAVPWLYDGARPSLRHAPLLGDSTDAVMTELGRLSSTELEALRAEKVLA